MKNTLCAALIIFVLVPAANAILVTDQSVPYGTTTIDASLLPMPPAPHTFVLDRPTIVSAGTQFAIVLRNDGGSCTAMRGPDGDPYPLRGEGFFETTQKGPLTFFVDQLQPGQSITLAYKAIAGVKGGRATANVSFNGNQQSMETVMDVVR